MPLQPPRQLRPTSLNHALTIAINKNPSFEDEAACAATKWGVRQDGHGGEVLHGSAAGDDSGFLHGGEVHSTTFIGLWIWLGSWVGSEMRLGTEKKFTMYYM